MANHLKLNILIIGAGLGGLAAAISCQLAGHNVHVLEAAAELKEIGAGLQITPNASRLLFKWGLQQEIEKRGSEPRRVVVHKYDGHVLAEEKDFDKQMRSKYGAPFIDMHRGELHLLLHKRALELGVKITTGVRITKIESGAAITDTQRFEGDLIVGADGLWSKCRELFSIKKPLPTGDLAYRIVLNLADLKDEDLRELVRTPECHFWIGPKQHVVAYSMKASTMYNLVLLTPDDLPAEISKAPGSIEEMRRLFNGWDPLLQKFLDQVEEVEKWKLMHLEPLDKWVHGNIVLLGDSCHPMLPYLAQGANSALEDGAALGAVLENVQDLPKALESWESLRKQRGEAIVRETFEQQRSFHMDDGLEQEARDKIFESQLGKPISVKFPSRWTCPEVQPWLYGYDAYKEAQRVQASA